MTFNSILNDLRVKFNNKQQETGVLQVTNESFLDKKTALEKRAAELEASKKGIQQQIDAAGAAAELAERLGTEAKRRYDLEGDDKSGPLIDQYRNEKALALAEVMRLQAVRDEIPARVTAIRLELAHLAHRSDLQLLVGLKQTEQTAFLEYEKHALAMIDALYTFKLKRWERETVAERVSSFARSHQLQSPSRGDFSAPLVETYWNGPEYGDQIRAQFKQAKRDFN